MNVFRVVTPDVIYTGKWIPVPAGYTPNVAINEATQFTALIAAETRGKAKSIALKEWVGLWNLRMGWTDKISIRKVGVTSNVAGFIYEDDWYPYDSEREGAPIEGLCPNCAELISFTEQFLHCPYCDYSCDYPYADMFGDSDTP